MTVCPWCGSDIEYFTDDDNSNYNEYICEYYNKVNRFTGQKCWWRESSGIKAIERSEWAKKSAGIAIARDKAKAMISEGKKILNDIESGSLTTDKTRRAV